MIKLAMCPTMSKIFLKSNKLKYFVSTLKQLIHSKIKIKKIKRNHPFLIYGMYFLLLLQNPLITRYIIGLSKFDPNIIYEILNIIYCYHSKICNLSKSLSDFSLNIDILTASTLSSFIYLLNHKLLKHLIFDANHGRFFKKNISNIWDIALQKDIMEVITQSALINVARIWWEKLYKNKKYIYDVLKYYYDVDMELNQKLTLTIIHFDQNQSYPYVEDSIAFLIKNPRKCLGFAYHAMTHYKAPYMSMHNRYTICGNKKCQIGYFEHKYDEMYFDGTDVIWYFSF